MGATLLLLFLRLEVNFPGLGAGWRQGSGGPCGPCCLLQQAASISLSLVHFSRLYSSANNPLGSLVTVSQLLATCFKEPQEEKGFVVFAILQERGRGACCFAALLSPPSQNI